MDDFTKRWMREAERYSYHIYMYMDLIHDHPEATAAAVADKQDVYEYVEWLGEKYGLDRVDQGWGFHTDIKFKKAELV